MNIALNRNDRLLSIQFSFTNDDAVPMGLWNLGIENKQMAANRKQTKSAPTGKDLLAGDKPERITLAKLPANLVRNDYVLVNASYQKRQDQHRQNANYHMARFIFAYRDYEDKDDAKLQAFLPRRGLMLAELQELCEIALWQQVRIFRNPFFKDGTEVPGQSAISVNLDALLPIFTNLGSGAFALIAENPKWEIIMKNKCLLLNKVA